MLSTFRCIVCFLLVALALCGGKVFAQAGKVAGVVTDSTGEPLPGVNVLVQEEEVGAVTNKQGQFNVLNVSPGTYTVRFSFVGYQTKRIQGVEVTSGLATRLEVILAEEEVGLQGVTVTAQDEVVKEDISASRVDVSMDRVENAPVASISEAIELQPGIRSGLSVRGSGAEAVSYRLDGASLQSQRTGNPYTNISVTGVKEVQTQTGGFSAAQGNLRSGLINVTTREGSADRYTVDVLSRYRMPTQKHFGPKFNSSKTYYLRPYLDPEVKWEGTDQWDSFTRNQYREFQGYEEIAQSTLTDDNPNNDLTPKAAEQLFRWRHRRDVTINSPDWVVDGSIGGPVPGISDYLGDLRFFLSYRQVDREYIMPLNTRGYQARNARIKLTADLTPDMKLDIVGMTGQEKGTRIGTGSGTANRRAGVREEDREAIITSYRPQGFTWSTAEVAFSPSGLSRSIIERDMVSAKINHTISSNTFYDAQVKWFRSNFRAGPGLPQRDVETVKHTFARFKANEAPMGYLFSTRSSLVQQLRLAGHNSVLRDTSTYNQYDFKLDVTSQVLPSHEVKTGIRFNVSVQDERVKAVDALKDPSDTKHQWEKKPAYFAAYLQDKIEFKGMIANLGARFEYFDPRTSFPSFENAFSSEFRNAGELDQLPEEAVGAKMKVSPRAGVSFPITESSKLFFNYGHFVQFPSSENLYLVAQSRLTRAVYEMGNPYLSMPQTTAYEVGYEQSFFDQFLIRATGYYKDITNQPRMISYQGRQGLIDYSVPRSLNYEDIRGAEFSVYKNSGRWIRGFATFSYRVSKGGNFGFGTYFENPIQQRRYERQTTEHVQFRPLPRPYARMSLTFRTPGDFGPEFGWFRPIGQWRLNLLGRWREGNYFTYTGPTSVEGIQNNFQWPDFRMVDLRFSKDFNVSDTDLKFFLDVKNVFNIKNFNTASFAGGNDFDSYMKSLKLPKKKTKKWDRWPGENGNDKPGVFNKEYIDPPNLRTLRYLFPRSYKLGVRYSF